MSAPPQQPARRSPWDRLSHRLGRRGAVLCMMGVLWIVQGIAVGLSPATREPGAEYLVHELLPTWLRVTLWLGTGLTAVWAGFRQTPPGRDGPGFVALIILPVERAGSFALGFGLYVWHELVERVPWLPWEDTPTGYPRGVIGFATWTTVTALILVVAGWADPRNRAVTHPDRA